MNLAPILTLIFFTCSLLSCAPADKGVPVRVATTYSPPKPVVSREGAFDVVHGATEAGKIITYYNAVEKGLSLKGQMTLKPLSSQDSIEINLDVFGKANSDGRMQLTPKEKQTNLPADLRVGVTATCLGDELNCNEHFIDIYIEHEGKIYHHQLGSQEHPMVTRKIENEILKKDKIDKKVDDKNAQKVSKRDDIGKPILVSQSNIKAKDNSSAVKDGDKSKKEGKETTPKTSSGENQPEEDDSEIEDDEGQEDPDYQGRYLGDIEGDIQKLFWSTGGSVVTTDSYKIPKGVILDQVIGIPSKGRLEKASSLLELQKKPGHSVGYRIIRSDRERYFGSVELLSVIQDMGKYTESIIPNYKLAVGDLSKKYGGKLGKHASHQNGLDVDVAFYTSNSNDQSRMISVLSRNTSGTVNHSWMEDEQWKLFKFIVGKKYVDRIFIHPELKKSFCQNAIHEGKINRFMKSGEFYETLRRLRSEKNHYNHFHLRVKCSKAQIRCRQMADPPQGTGCF